MRDEPTTETPKLAPVLTDEPIVVPRPRRAVAKVAIAYMLAILIVGAASVYLGYGLARRDLDRRLKAVERYQSERRDVRDEEKRRADAERADTDARVQRLRQLVCVFADRLPRDSEVEKVRAEYGCTGNPAPSTTPSSLPDPPGQPNVPGPRGGQTPQQIPPPRSGQPQPAPQPPAQPPDPPDGPEPEPDDGGLICLPLLGCLL